MMREREKRILEKLGENLGKKIAAFEKGKVSEFDGKYSNVINDREIREEDANLYEINVMHREDNPYRNLSTEKGLKYHQEAISHSLAVISNLTYHLYESSGGHPARSDPLWNMYETHEDWTKATESRLEYEKKKLSSLEKSKHEFIAERSEDIKNSKNPSELIGYILP